MRKFVVFALAFAVAAMALESGAARAQDRHAGYYYPAPTSRCLAPKFCAIPD